MTGSVRIEGDRVRLRDWRAEDVDRLAGWFVPGAAWKEFDAPYYPLPDAAGRRQYLASRRASAGADDLPTPRTDLVIADPETDHLVGQVSWSFESQESDWRRMGIVLFDPARWGGGRGTEAIELWTSYLFATTDVVRLDYATWSGNIGMLRIGHKLGFVEEARFRKARDVNGCRYDSVVMGVLREDWPAARSAEPRA